ncbi:MAG TPA: DciA family protein [Steroidobacteraceae bacterium]|nr:DciA family protein [Steroidobacteraceae bacterium]
MPKNPRRDNRPDRASGTIRSAASLLRRINQRSEANIYQENQLDEYLRQRLPEALRPHVLQAIEKPGELVILVDSANWAARLRLALAAVAGVGQGRRITVKVTPQGTTRR